MHNPFTVAELLDHLMSFLHDSALDLIACALVSRSWVQPAQSYLFSRIRLVDPSHRAYKNMIMWRRLQDTLKASPHLVEYIRHLDLNIRLDEGPTFWEICGFPFTHLKEIEIYYATDLHKSHARALCQLFSRPLLRRVRLTGSSPKARHFRKMFERCSTELKHLQLRCCIRVPLRDLTAPQSRPAVPLTSLRIGLAGEVDHRFLSALHPFDLAHLKVLSLHGHVRIHWNEVAQALTAVEILCLTLKQTHWGLDLSVFPNLSHLRITTARGFDKAIEADNMRTLLSTIASVPSIHISIYFVDMKREVCEIVDAALCGLPLRTVEAEVNLQDLHLATEYLPQLHSNNMLRVVPHNFHWWKDVVETLG
ncbi:hypothetical protein DFH06DRAFT_1325164 [Mycena polygramma]|nr:hypothetical protein DFH06DRAFT_1325164 [Mycena polygramma]